MAIPPIMIELIKSVKSISWSLRKDSNLHAFLQWNLNPSCLSFHHSGILKKRSNPTKCVHAPTPILPTRQDLNLLDQVFHATQHKIISVATLWSQSYVYCGAYTPSGPRSSAPMFSATAVILDLDS